jgi:hypothetical protein
MTPLDILTIASRMKALANTKGDRADQLKAGLVDAADRLSDLATAAQVETGDRKLIALSAEEIEHAIDALDTLIEDRLGSIYVAPCKALMARLEAMK